jgi:tetratricopeptide (TPR) repeat protein
MLAKLAEKQADLQRALNLYLQYPQRFPQRDRLVMQAYAGALTVASKLGDNAAVEQILAAITNRAASVEDYNTHLNLAYHYEKTGQHELAKKFLESGIALAGQTLERTTEPAAHCEIHFRVLRRLGDIAKPDQLLEYFAHYAGEISGAASQGDDDALTCVISRQRPSMHRADKMRPNVSLNGFWNA